MSTTIKLSDELVTKARHYGEIYHRSIPKRIEYWSAIGKIAEENPDLSYNFIRDILLAKKDVDEGNITPYEFGQLS